ncbi:MAG: bifunctional methylenetetrahydrofolate dehydrogenase/methenyltetrahydrofolate cyclohydrolase FolD [Clostridia bacterium]|nr:bifunctional methylenetetrahydrofolate dehydrogenase/methenyltetrahydrofolate cyclohydrolase FolD [Clostridia bacterium]
MSAVILDGKALAASIREDLSQKVQTLIEETGVKPTLAVIVAGDDPASAVYVRNKERACIGAGMGSIVDRLPQDVTQEELEALVRRYNEDDSIHGILVQLPLPKHLDESRVLELIDPKKDVDGFHAVNMGALLSGMEGFVPCTPKGVMRLIESAGIDLSGKNAVIVGRSNIVGKPAALLLLQKNATVTVCHSKTEDLSSFTKNADVLVAAVGRPNMITGDMVKPGAVVIDVGINRTESGLVGDVDFASASEVAGYITPVPGGVGPMTIAMLLENTYIGAKNSCAKA